MDKQKTSFSTPRGKYEFNVTPYGLCNAGATYQRMMYMDSSGLSTTRVLAYLEMILPYLEMISPYLEMISSYLEMISPYLAARTRNTAIS